MGFKFSETLGRLGRSKYPRELRYKNRVLKCGLFFYALHKRTAYKELRYYYYNGKKFFLAKFVRNHE